MSRPFDHKQLAPPRFMSRFDDDLADEVESGRVAVPVVPTTSVSSCWTWSSLPQHAVNIMPPPLPMPTVVSSSLGVHAVLVTVTIVRLSCSPSHVAGVGTDLAACADPRPSLLCCHVVTARPDVPAAPLRCSWTKHSQRSLLSKSKRSGLAARLFRQTSKLLCT